jgi:two-component system CheB/CheR fusion protein
MNTGTPWFAESGLRLPEPVKKKARGSNFDELTRRVLLQAYAPASVVTDLKGDILYVYGDTGRYLRPAPGQATLNLIEMAREGLQLELRSLLLNAPVQGDPTLTREASVKTNGGFSTVSVSLRRLPATAGTAGSNETLLFSFIDVAAPPKTPASRSKKVLATAEQQRAEQLERELAYARESQQASVEEHQAFSEELKSTNEELQSTNEELQSSNEELETSKEELQSLNEEMVTVISELNAKFELVSDLQNDMKNLLDSISTGTLFLDHQLRIRRYTPAVLQIYRLIASDIGRPLADITANLDAANLLADLQTVLDTLIPIEREVRTGDGAWYLARMQPYRTLDNVIAGVVLTFTAVTDFKRVSEAAQQAEAQLAATRLTVATLAQELAEGIVNTISEPLLVLDGGLRVVSASRSFYAHFQVTAEETVGRKIYNLGSGQWDLPVLRQLLESILPRDQALEGYELDFDLPGLGPRRMRLNARQIVTAPGQAELILLALATIEAVPAP